MAAVLEYLTAEVLELAGNVSQNNKRKRIIPKDLTQALGQDVELLMATGGAVISEGGVLHKGLSNE